MRRRGSPSPSAAPRLGGGASAAATPSPRLAARPLGPGALRVLWLRRWGSSTLTGGKRFHELVLRSLCTYSAADTLRVLLLSADTHNFSVDAIIQTSFTSHRCMCCIKTGEGSDIPSRTKMSSVFKNGSTLSICRI